MRNDDPDILAVRSLPPSMADPTEDSVGRTWMKMSRIRASRDRATRPATRRWLIPVTAAALVAALIGGAALWLKPGADGAPYQAAVNGSGLRLSDALDILADAAEKGEPAAAVGPGQLVFVKIDGWAARITGDRVAEMQPQTRLIWHDPHGMNAVEITDGKTSMLKGSGRGTAAPVTPDGPSFYVPTPQWLAGLPADPDRLAKLLTDTVHDSKWSTPHEVWSMMEGFYTSSDLLLSPAVRAALFRSYTAIDGLQAAEMTIGGKRYIGLRHVEQQSADEVLFDPSTGRAVGKRSLYGGEMELLTTPGQPILDKGVTFQAFFTQEVVTGQRLPEGVRPS
ncbi:MAG: hypothetical protein HOV79_12740 [Hamadaea sp.]|nr:hypothetical protein [Hamadaea sp.]